MRFYNDKFSQVNAVRKGSRETSVVRPSGFYKGLGEREVRGLEAGRRLSKYSQAEGNIEVTAFLN